VDTNVLLHQLDALQQFVIDIEHHLPFTLQIIIPGIVISELDRCVYSAIILIVDVSYFGQTENAE
jgi:predicted ribonuclease YlaK